MYYELFLRNKSIGRLLLGIGMLGISGHSEYTYAAREVILALEHGKEQKNAQKRKILIEKEKKEEAEELELPKKRIQLLTVFLDNSEALPGSTISPVTQDLLAAIFEKAGPILTAGSLLYNILDGPFAQSEEGSAKKVITQEFKKFFRQEDWIIKWVAPGLVIMVPKSYLQEQEITLDDIGLHMLSTSLTIGEISAAYAQLPPFMWGDVGKTYVDALLTHTIFDESNRTIDWIIYKNGHGKYGESITGIELVDFSRVLDHLNTYVDVELFICKSCNAAGFNAAQVYGELKKPGRPKEYLSTGQPRFAPEYLANDVKEYRFPIVTAAIADTVVYSSLLSFNNDGSIKTNTSFKEFMQEFSAFKHAMTDDCVRFGFYPSYRAVAVRRYNTIYGKLLALIIPSGYAGTLPQIRYAYSPAWFPVSMPTCVYQEETAIVRINDIMAFTRTAPLIIGSFRYDKRLTAMLLDTYYVPFEIVLENQEIDAKEPYIIITLSGDAEIYCEKIRAKRVPLTTFFPVNVNAVLDCASFIEPFYKGNKRLYIKEFVLDTQDRSVKEMPDGTYTNVVVDFARECFYYTDAEKKQFVVHKHENGAANPREYFDNYEALYSDSLLTNKSIIDKAAQHWKIQQLERIVSLKYAQKIENSVENKSRE